MSDVKITFDHPDDFEFLSSINEITSFKGGTIWRDISTLLEEKLKLYRNELEDFELTGDRLTRIRAMIQALDLFLEIPDFILLTKQDSNDGQDRTDQTAG